MTAQEFQPKDWMSQAFHTFREIWLDVVGLEDYAMVSQYGRIYLKKSGKITDGSIHNSKSENSYLFVKINGRGYGVHKLVCTAFWPNPEQKRDVNHLNGVKWLNPFWNLQHATRSENVLHCYHVLKRKRMKGMGWKISAETKAVIRTEYLAGITQTELAKKYSTSQSHVSRIILNKV